MQNYCCSRQSWGLSIGSLKSGYNDIKGLGWRATKWGKQLTQQQNPGLWCGAFQGLSGVPAHLIPVSNKNYKKQFWTVRAWAIPLVTTTSRPFSTGSEHFLTNIRKSKARFKNKAWKHRLSLKASQGLTDSTQGKTAVSESVPAACPSPFRACKTDFLLLKPTICKQKVNSRTVSSLCET